ncbi:MAG: sigma-70 family RNA polymerase sigma factor [Streptosporangiales bacterium]|nr:sigma-70 family RNA polymerase sigma factor [Streptosporangiales bacterium]
MEPAVQAVAELADPITKAQRASELLADHQAAVVELSRVRREAVEQMLERGMSQSDVGKLIGMSRSRVGQLLKQGPRPERAFLGRGKLTVALGMKTEAAKDSGKAGPVVAIEDLAAFEALSELARTVQLDAESELIKPPGLVDLNRDNLVVICGPRLSPLVAQILASDPHVAFGNDDDDGWYLEDRTAGKTFRSPSDAGTPGDFAYLGRLPRPDAKGSFLYIAGIHAVGAAGVAHFLDHHMADAYKQVKTQRFSCIVECRYDPETGKVTESNRVTPFYRPEVTA